MFFVSSRKTSEPSHVNTPVKIACALFASIALSPGLLAQAAPSTPTKPETPGEDAAVVLTPFEVTAAKDNGYQATETLAGTRIRTNLGE